MSLKDRKIEAIKKELVKYKFKIEDSVQFAEVDSFNVVHNVRYFYWIERSRTEYFKNLGIPFHPRIFTEDYPFMVVKAAAEYFNAARFGDEYRVWARLSKIGNKSIFFENIIILKTGEVLTKAEAVLAFLDPKTGKSARVPDSLRKLAREFEGEDLIMKE